MLLSHTLLPCGPGTRHQRFKVSKDGNSVCDNKTGLWWQQKPGDPEVTDNPCTNTATCMWQQAIDYCAGLNVNGKHKKKQWRLAKAKELWTLVDLSEPNPATALNEPKGPFQNVQGDYWSATEQAGMPMYAWFVGFIDGRVAVNNKVNFGHAWCVSGG